MLNICKWANVCVDYDKLVESCGGKEQIRRTGTDTPIFHIALSNLPGVEIESINYIISTEDVDSILKKGNIIALTYLIRNDWGHFCLILGKKGSKYLVANALEKRPLSLISERTLRKMIDETDFILGTFNCSVAWELKTSK